MKRSLSSTLLGFAGLAAAAVGLGLGCGPEEKYCFDNHATCAEARRSNQMACEDMNAQRADAGLEPIQCAPASQALTASPDAGATVQR